MTIRTRIAPSPTGDPHVGTAYIALFNMCFAHSQGGQFILRIEDTDQLRSTQESEQQILESLSWLGMNWDEGPDVGGPYGPYRQSERTEIYREHAMRLVEQGYAFYCFRSPEELEAIREERRAQGLMPGIKGQDLELPAEEVQRRLAAGEPYVIRMKVPDEGVCEVQDMLRGTIEVDWGQIDCQILLKSDGLPTYHLANVVDDHLMGITHVIRGEEWINSAPKHILLYQYFGWEMPQLCHMPLLRNPDKSKLSKRKNPTSINYYHRMGYLPEALLNYLGRMGWSMPNEQEKFTIDEMVENFDIQRVSLGGPIFDTTKLDWLNASYIRENLSEQEFVERLKNWAFNEGYISQIVPQVKGRVERLSDVIPMAAFFFSGMLDIKESDFDHIKLEREQLIKVLQFSLWRLEALRSWNKENVMAEVKQLSNAMDLKMKDFLAPFFIAIAGASASSSVLDSMAIIGSDMTRARLRHAIDVLGGVSKKKAKKLEKEYRALSETD